MVIEVTKNQGVCYLSINRPKVLNALNQEVILTLNDRLIEAEHDPSVKVIVITGHGEKAFVAGADINEFQTLKDQNAAANYSRLGQSTFNQLDKCSKPVIAAINGYALGGGMELALACDSRFASSHATFGFPEIKLGLYPGYGGAQRLPRLVGKGMAFHLMMSGETISSQEALRIGLVEKVFPQQSFEQDVWNYALKVSRFSSVALALLKETITNGLEMPLEHALEIDAKNMGELMISEPVKKSVQLFLEKREQ